MPRPASHSWVLSLEVDLSAASIMRDDVAVMLTHDMWTVGKRPEGRDGVKFEAQRGSRDPEAPAYRKVADLRSL